MVLFSFVWVCYDVDCGLLFGFGYLTGCRLKLLWIVLRDCVRLGVVARMICDLCVIVFWVCGVGAVHVSVDCLCCKGFRLFLI